MGPSVAIICGNKETILWDGTKTRSNEFVHIPPLGAVQLQNNGTVPNGWHRHGSTSNRSVVFSLNISWNYNQLIIPFELTYFLTSLGRFCEGKDSQRMLFGAFR